MLPWETEVRQLMGTNQCHRLLNSKAKFNRAVQPQWGRGASELDKQVPLLSRHSVPAEQSTKTVEAAPVLGKIKI